MPPKSLFIYGGGMIMSYIYKISNDINDKIYVGKTELSIEERFKYHCKDAFRDRNEKRPLYNAMTKYGIEHFSVELIEECSLEEAPMREQYWIGFYEGYSKGYNATLGGDGKAFIDRNEILKLWNEHKALTEICEITGYDKGWVSHILHSNGVETAELISRGIQTFSKEVQMLDKKTNEVLNSFCSTRAAARYLIDNDLTHTKEGGCASHISEVCNGKRKTCCGYKWQYANL